MSLENWKDVVDNLPQQRVVHHGQLDVCGAGGLQEHQILRNTELLETSHHRGLQSTTATFGSHSVFSSETINLLQAGSGVQPGVWSAGLLCIILTY